MNAPSSPHRLGPCAPVRSGGLRRVARVLRLGFASVLAVVALAAAEKHPSPFKPTERIEFRRVGKVTLHVEVFAPRGQLERSGKLRPAIVFFFGGGWRKGTTAMFHPFAAHLAERGMIAMCAEYRVQEVHGTDPFAAVADARAALRWVRSNHARLGIDPQRIAAGGGSSGGHLAAACALLPGLDDPTDDVSVSCRPDALVLFNPVIDNGPDGYGHERVRQRWREFSPMEHITAAAPPTIFLTGSEDQLVPVATAKRFAARMQAVGARCDLKVYAGAKHSFFNYNDGKGAFYPRVIADLDAFLESLGWISHETE